MKMHTVRLIYSIQRKINKYDFILDALCGNDIGCLAFSGMAAVAKIRIQ